MQTSSWIFPSLSLSASFVTFLCAVTQQMSPAENQMHLLYLEY